MASSSSWRLAAWWRAVYCLALGNYSAIHSVLLRLLLETQTNYIAVTILSILWIQHLSIEQTFSPNQFLLLRREKFYLFTAFHKVFGVILKQQLELMKKGKNDCRQEVAKSSSTRFPSHREKYAKTFFSLLLRLTFVTALINPHAGPHIDCEVCPFPLFPFGIGILIENGCQRRSANVFLPLAQSFPLIPNFYWNWFLTRLVFFFRFPPPLFAYTLVMGRWQPRRQRLENYKTI